jgi:predicted nucleotidyltransferase
MIQPVGTDVFLEAPWRRATLASPAVRSAATSRRLRRRCISPKIGAAVRTQACVASAKVLGFRMVGRPAFQALQARIATALEPFGEVRVAYLFGSQALGTARADSDLDVALRFERAVSEQRRGELLLRIIEQLSKELGPLGERADLLDLDRASSTVAFRAIRDGKCVLSRHPRDRIRLEAQLARRYDDERPYRELFRRAARGAAERMSKASRG